MQSCFNDSVRTNQSNQMLWLAENRSTPKTRTTAADFLRSINEKAKNVPDVTAKFLLVIEGV